MSGLGKITLSVLLLGALSLLPVTANVDLSKSVDKKIGKTLTRLWPESKIRKEAVKPDQTKAAALSFKLAPKQLFRLKNGTTLTGYLYLDDARGRYDKFDYMVIFSPQLSILTTQVLVYREEYGGEIGSKRWLKQFKGKSNGRSMVFEKDIRNISGATISARSITRGIKKLTVNIRELKDRGML